MTISDDAPVPDDVPLFHRVHPVHIVWDDDRRCQKVSSGLFRHPEMSVDLGDKLEELGVTPDSLVDAFSDHALVVLFAGAARECKQEIVRQPLPSLPAHGLIVGKKTQGVQRALARASEWVVRPDDACDPPYP